MNSIYKSNFKVSQKYKPSTHTGMDLVGEDKKLYSNLAGEITKIGWENMNNPKQGFGKRIWIRNSATGLYHVYGHMSEFNPTLQQGDFVEVGTYLGKEGNTGCSTGSHCHYEIRESMAPGKSKPCYDFLGIKNVEGPVVDPIIELRTKMELKLKGKGLAKVTVDYVTKCIEDYKYAEDLYKKLLK